MKKDFIVERQGKSYVLYAGLLDDAHAQGLKSIRTTLLQIPSAENGNVAICHATVETDRGTFEGIGDANPGNVAKPMIPAIIRMAETRSKARALRDAINVGVVALEEVGDEDEPAPSPNGRSKASVPPTLAELRAGYDKLTAKFAELHVTIPALPSDATAEQVRATGAYWKAMLARCEQSGILSGLLAEWCNYWRQLTGQGVTIDPPPTSITDTALRDLVAGLAHSAKGTPAKAPASPPAAPATNGNAPAATEAQVKAIYAIGRGLGWTEGQLTSYAQSRYGTPPELLAKPVASKLIDDLKSKQEGAKDEVAL